MAATKKDSLHKDTHKPDPTSLALSQTVLASERTFQSWIRTGLTALATGLGIANFLQESMPLWMLLTITTILLVLSILAFLQVTWRYKHLHIRMKHLDVDATPIWLVKAFSYSLAGCALLALLALYLTAFGGGAGVGP